MTPAEQRYANEAWEMSDKAYVDGIELLHLIELLQRQNTGVVNDKLNAAGAGDAANFIRNAILSRIVLFVAGAYAPARRGDLHLKRAFDLLKCPAVFHELGLRGSPKLLDEAKGGPSAAQTMLASHLLNISETSSRHIRASQ